MNKHRALTAIDLFCGAGGLSEGFRQAGYRVLAGNDIDSFAGQTFARTHPEAKFFPGPIEDITAEMLFSATGLLSGQLDCLIGGPPCQAFSVYNHQRGMHDRRSKLFREYLRLVESLRPAWIVLENVTGILSAGNGEAVADITAGLNALGYRVEKRILKAEEYGIPQERRRLVFIGTSTDLAIRWPLPTHGHGLKPFVTIGDAISDLPTLKNGEDAGALPYAAQPQNAYQALMRGACQRIENHAAPRLAPINLARMKHIPPGGNWLNIPDELLPSGMKRARKCDHTKRYGRPRLDDLACTILTKCDLHWGAFIHPSQDRSFSVREAARLQSFPDRFIFQGPRTEQYVQVGNAVPPLLGRVIAQAIQLAHRDETTDLSSLPLFAAVG